MSRERRRPGDKKGRAPAPPRVPTDLKELMSARCKANTELFRQHSAWLRLVALGVLLIDLAILTFVNILFEKKLVGYSPGTGSIFGGLLIAIIITRLSRPGFAVDWVAIGVLNVALGILLVQDPLLTSMMTLLVFCLLFMAGGVLKLWIGATLGPGKGSASITAGGLTGLLCFGCFLVDRFVTNGIGPEVFAAIDLTLSGFAFVGLGVASRPPKAK